MAIIIRNIEKMDDTELLSYTTTVGVRLEANNHDIHALQTEWYKRYRSSKDYLSKVVKDKVTPQLVSARPFQQCEIIKSLMLGNNPEIFAKFEQNAAEHANRVLKFTNDSLWDKGGINYEFVLEQTENDRVICGTGIEKLWWDREVATRRVRRPITFMGAELPESFMGMDLTKEVDEKYFKVNQCMGGQVDPLQFDADPLIPNIKDQPEIRERMTMLYSEIKKNCDNEYFYNWDKVKDLIEGEQEQNENVIARRSVSHTGTYTETTDDTHDPLIKVHQYWFKPNWIVTVIPGRVVLQKTRHNYGRPPYVVKKFIQYCTDFWGIGMIEPLVPLFDEKDQIRNLRMSAKRRAYGLVAIMNRAYMRNPDADVTPKDFWLWDMKDINKGVRFESPRTNDDLVREEGIVDREIDNEGANPYLAGSGGSSEEAASRTAMVTRASGNKFKRERGNMENGVEEFVEMFCTMNKQHLTDNKEFSYRARTDFMFVSTLIIAGLIQGTRGSS